MATTLYDRTRADINPSQLYDELNASVGITPTCEWIRIDGTDSITMAFDNPLSASEVTEMESILAAHVAIAPIRLVVDAYQLTGIGGVKSEPMSFSPDATRADKILSSETFTLIYSESRVNNMDWIQIGHASDSDSGFIMPFDGTIVRATAHCENARNRTFNFHLYKNDFSQGSLFQISGNGEQTASALDLNIDFDAGDKLRVRGIGSAWIEDTVIVVWIKWRKV